MHSQRSAWQKLTASFGSLRDAAAPSADEVLGRVLKTPTTIVEDDGLGVRKTLGFDNYKFADLGVTEQFLGDADIYYQKYTNPSHFRDLYRHAIQAKNLSAGPYRVLDLGTGGGNSLFALADLLGPISAVGIDISQPLLKLCARTAKEQYNDRAISLVCADLYDLDVVPNSVDLVGGSSILHHMIDPGPIVDLALKALKPGGHAIFIEPFESGHGILRGLYALVLDLNDKMAESISEDIKMHLEAYIMDFDARRGVGDVRHFTPHLDDKWFFTEEWFRARLEAWMKSNERVRFRWLQHSTAQCVRRNHPPDFGHDIQFISTHSGKDIFWEQFAAMAKLDNGADTTRVPTWVREVFAAFDQTFSAVQKQEIAFSALIVMTKPQWSMFSSDAKPAGKAG